MQFTTFLRHALMYRFIVVNVFALALVAVAVMNGWVAMILLADTTHVVATIIAVFVYGLGLSTIKAWQLSAINNHFLSDAPLTVLGWQNVTAESLKMRAAANLTSVRSIATFLFLIGLIGTVIGLSIALGGVDPTAAADVSKVGAMVATLIHGVSVKFYASMVALMLSLWTLVNHTILSIDSFKIIAKALEAKGSTDG
jgi:hypothetical protein